MANECKLPALGENIDSGDVVNILVREGDQIEPNQGIIELETDKAVIEVPSPFGGKVSKIHVNKGDTVQVGQTLLTVEGVEQTKGESPKAAEPTEEKKVKKPASQERIAEKRSEKSPERGEQKEGEKAPRASEESAPERTGPLPAGWHIAGQVPQEAGLECRNPIDRESSDSQRAGNPTAPKEGQSVRHRPPMAHELGPSSGLRLCS